MRSGFFLRIHKGRVGEIYNIAGKNEWKNLELTRSILKIMNKSEDLIEFVQDRPGHDRRYALDSTKIDKLGWNPSYDFEQALGETVEWYRQNQKWWQGIKK